MAQIPEPRQLKDFEILGVGASRRAALLAVPGPRVLWTHRTLIAEDQRPLYEAVLQETLDWLQPLEIREAPPLSPAALFELLRADFLREFPQTSHYLKGHWPELLQAYLREFPWRGPLLSDHFRYLPVFLREQIQDSRLYLMAQREWLWSSLSFMEFGFPASEPGRVFVSPSLQSLYSVTEISEVGLTPGLTVFYYDHARGRVRDYKMDVWDAAVVDLLQEERKFNLDQLLEQALLLENSLDREAWLKKLLYLKTEGIILESGSERIPG